MAGTLHTQVVLLSEVVPQESVSGEIVLSPVALAEVAPEVDLAEVGVECVVVKEAFVAELAEGVLLVAGVLRVPLPPVPNQLLSSVLSQLKGK